MVILLPSESTDLVHGNQAAVARGLGSCRDPCWAQDSGNSCAVGRPPLAHRAQCVGLAEVPRAAADPEIFYLLLQVEKALTYEIRHLDEARSRWTRMR